MHRAVSYFCLLNLYKFFMEIVLAFIFAGIIYAATLFGVFYVFLKPDVSDFYAHSLAEREPFCAIAGGISILCQLLFITLILLYLRWWGLLVGLVPLLAAYYPIRCLVRFRFMQKMKRLNLYRD